MHGSAERGGTGLSELAEAGDLAYSTMRVPVLTFSLCQKQVCSPTYSVKSNSTAKCQAFTNIEFYSILNQRLFSSVTFPTFYIAVWALNHSLYFSHEIKKEGLSQNCFKSEASFLFRQHKNS